MLEAYEELVDQIKTQQEMTLKPQEEIEKKAERKSIEIANALSLDGVQKEILNLKGEFGNILIQLSNRLEEEVRKYGEIQKAIGVKTAELKEIFEIEKEAASVAALIELQRKKKEEFEGEMAARKEELTREIETTKNDWEAEEKQRREDTKRMDAEEQERRKREEEDFRYQFARRQKEMEDAFEDRRRTLERELTTTKEETEKVLVEREKAVAQKEEELKDLRLRVASFPKELEETVVRAVKEKTEKIQLEAKTREEMMRRDYEGEKNVFTTRIVALENTATGQKEQIAKLASQLEKSYVQVQSIAVKAVEGSTQIKSFANLQTAMGPQTRSSSQER